MSQNGGMEITTHSINKFKERSNDPRLKKLTVTQFRRIMRHHIRRGEIVHSSQSRRIYGSKFQITKFYYWVNGQKIVLYAIGYRNYIDKIDTVVTLYTEK